MLFWAKIKFIMKLYESYKKDDQGNPRSNNLGCAIGLAFFLGGPAVIVSLYNFIKAPADRWPNLVVSIFLVFSLAFLFFVVSRRSSIKREEYVTKYDRSVQRADDPSKDVVEAEFKDVTDKDDKIE